MDEIKKEGEVRTVISKNRKAMIIYVDGQIWCLYNNGWSISKFLLYEFFLVCPSMIVLLIILYELKVATFFQAAIGGFVGGSFFGGLMLGRGQEISAMMNKFSAKGISSKEMIDILRAKPAYCDQLKREELTPDKITQQGSFYILCINKNRIKLDTDIYNTLQGWFK